MQFTLETQGTSSFLTYCMKEDDVVDSMSMGMISNNHIEGIIPFHYLQMDTSRYLKYNISSKISLSQYFNGVVNKHRLLTVMESIAATVLNAEDYMLDASVFVWDKEYIFIDAATAKANLICVPIEVEGKNGKVNLEQFFRQLLLGVQFDQSENCDYVAKLLGFFNANTHFSLADFHSALIAISNGTMGSMPVQHMAAAPVISQLQVVKESPVVKTENASIDSGKSVAPSISSGNMAIPSGNAGRKIPEQFESPKVSVAAEEKKEKKGFSLFGSKKKEEKKEAKADKKAEKRGAKKEEPRPIASFGGMRIPGRENEIYTPVDTAAKEVPISPVSITTSSPVSIPTPALTPVSVSTPQPKPIHVPVAKYDDDRTEITDSDVTEIADSDVTQGIYAWLELVYATQPGAMARIDLDFGKQSVLLGRISSDAAQPDVAFPSDFKKIGRQHARIERRGMDYYITDLGSVNHTLLDGVVLTPNQPYLLRDGMELTLTTSKTVQYRVHM